MLPLYYTFYLKKGKGESIHQAACIYTHLCVLHLNFEINNRFLRNFLRFWRIFQCRNFLRSANSNHITNAPRCDVATMSRPLTLRSCTNAWSQSLRKHGTFVTAYYCGQKLFLRLGRICEKFITFALFYVIHTVHFLHFVGFKNMEILPLVYTYKELLELCGI
jgi:hypothetical protein